MIHSTFPNSTVNIESRAQAALSTCRSVSDATNEIQQRYSGRVSWELEYIRNAGLTPYISAVTVLVDRAHDLSIVVGSGRGSSPSSLVLYLLGVTQIDPIAHGLIVERWFSNPVIEIDVDWYRRDDLLDDLWARYGYDHVAYISVYRRDTSNGEILSRGAHAACFAVSSLPIGKVMPTWTAIDGRLVLDAERDEVEANGIVVLTILGMKELSRIADTTISLGQRNTRFGFHETPEDDASTMEIFRTAETDGVFLFGSNEMKVLLARAQPESRKELLSLSGVYRPPFIQDGTIEELVRRMRKTRGFDQDGDPGLPEDELANINVLGHVLADTYGLLLFQEQFIEIVHRLTGWSYLVSEVYRHRAKTKAYDETLQDELIMDARKTGALSENQEHWLRELIVRSRHAVSKSHVVAYARTGWVMAYLKAHHRDQFLASLDKLWSEVDSL